MVKATKKTKKFQAKHLKHTMDQRKKVQQHNRLHKKKTSSSAARLASDEKKSNEIFPDMDVEEFFEGKLELPKESKALKKALKEKADAKESSEDEADVHGQDLQELAKDDPEFYQYLQENDKDLLDFKPVDPLEAMSDSEDDEEVGTTEKPTEFAEEEEERETIEVTMKLVKSWDENLKSTKPTIKTLKSIVIAFKSAVNMDSGERYRYSVTDEKVFNHLMFLALNKLPIAIQKLASYKKGSNGVRSLQTNNKKIAQITTILKSHAGSLIILLNDITNTETAALILKSVQELLPFFISLRKLLKEIVAAIINVWSSTKEVETQIAAFAFLNNSCREYPKAILELVLKSTYSSFIKKCRQTNIHTMPMINFQKNSAVELFGLDETLGYQIGFEYIRQLAIHLRSSVNNPTKDSYKAIYNWQYCHSLDFWSRMLSTQCNPEKELTRKKESPLRQLIYPLVQVTLGAIRLIPTAQFFPLRFYLIRSLIRLSQNTGVYIPLFPLLSEILNSTAITRNPKNSNLQAVDFDHVIKVNQAYLNTRVYQDGLCEQFLDLTSEFFVLYCKSIAFPELITPAVIYLRRYIKKVKNVKFSKQLSNLVDKLNTNAKFIEQKRSTVEYGPSNRSEVAKFLQDLPWEKTPLGSYVLTQREVREARAQILRDSILADEEDKAKSKAAEDDDEDIEMSQASEEEEEEEEAEEEEDSE
ncbi:hypothetical protein CANARDRAFT_201363 [[Candida] arabinofermentans NRRL YB-2248]|uniref:Nucleolar complex protein 2 n=1 Tax=[Candida] arabinofermentans NRRL YB-2248 TaxID=983967 RepID=A0A1E4SXG2_9ASCO|nr:hypothetical protein CANARDRAFT_201363 [[Candida] arabinofermentans NRRL YB-2248]